MCSDGQHRLDSETCFDERRRNRRLKARLDIVVRLNDPSGNHTPVEKTRTQNISSGDMYFESSFGDRLKLGDVIDVDIELPVRTSTIFSERRLEARGKVVRLGLASEDEPNRRGVAIVFVEPPAFHRALG